MMGDMDSGDRACTGVESRLDFGFRLSGFGYNDDGDVI
jgi:hypothetical protein